MGHNIISLFENNCYKELVEKTNVVVYSDEKIDLEDNFPLQAAEALEHLKKLDISRSFMCCTCHIEFPNVEEQRDHFKTNFHIYNVKQTMCNLPPVSAEEFCLIKEHLIANSESETDSEDSLYKLDTNQARCEQESEDSDVFIQHANTGGRIYFINDQGKIFGVYRCLLHKKHERLNSHLLCQLVIECHQKSKWIILMIGGGHFAGAVFNGSSIIEHKTIHSYTVRAKQGTSQSRKDSSGKHPKSAGSGLRRYNEEAFAHNVQETLGQWKDHFVTSHFIFYHAGVHNQKLIFGKQSPIKKTDPRVRSIPLPTQKASFKEVKHIHHMLSTVDVFDSCETYQTTVMPRSTQQNSFKQETNLLKESVYPKPQSQAPQRSSDGDKHIVSEAGNLLEINQLENITEHLPAKRKKRKVRRKSRTHEGKDRDISKININHISETSEVEFSEEKKKNIMKSDSDKQNQPAPMENPVVRNSTTMTGHHQTSGFQSHSIEETEEEFTGPSLETKRKEIYDNDTEVQEKECQKGTKKRPRRRKIKLKKDKVVPKQELKDQQVITENIIQLSSLCCQCCKDFAGCTPYQYYDFKFCSIQCLKLHRAHANSKN